MKIKKIQIEKLVAYENNARIHSSEHIGQIAKSIETFGFNVPVLVDGQNSIIAGHGRVLAAEKLGLESIPTLCIDHLNDEQKKAFILADNKIAMNSTWDEELLKGELKELEKTDFDISVIGFDDIELDKLVNYIDIEKDQEPEMKFTEEVGEANNYVVLVFNNDIDWLNAQDHFELETRYNKRPNGKPWSKGIGRVVDGSEYLHKIQKI